MDTLKKFLTPSPTIGLELINNTIKGAEVSFLKGKPYIKNLFDLALGAQSSHVKQLYMQHPFLVTGLDACDVLVRPLYLPLIKEKDIASALVFQAEPLLPYPVDQALLARQTLNHDEEGTLLTLMATRKDFLQKHIETYQQWKIEPEKVACVQSALCYFGQAYLNTENATLILYLNEKWMTCVLAKNGKLIASYTHQEGLDLIYKAFETENKEDQSIDLIDFNHLDDHAYPLLSEAVKRLQKALGKMYLALQKDAKGEPIEGILATGNMVSLLNLNSKLTEKLNIAVLQCSGDFKDSFSVKDKQCYAVPIGLALGSLQGSVDFRQQELSYPHPWKRIKIPLAAYFVLMGLLTTAFYIFGQSYLHYKEDQLKQDYVEFLATMGKSYEQSEQAFLAKNPQEKRQEDEIIAAVNLSRDDLLKRIEFVYKDLQATPDSFPLFANVPTVTDVLAWLSNHPNVMHQTADGQKEDRMQLENFTYTMLKRPTHGKKQEKYQVKVELELSSPTPKWAREFHDSLIAPNAFVDPKGEVKWSSNRGKYRTSFYLKDKTVYPSL